MTGKQPSTATDAQDDEQTDATGDRTPLDDAVRQRLAKRVTTDGLSKEEQETAFMFFGDSDRFKLTTYRPTIVRSVLEHALAEIEWVYVSSRSERRWREENPTELLDGEGPFAIEGVCATLPIGTLTVKGSERTSNRQSKIVTTPGEIEGLDEKFASSDTEGEA